MCHIIIGWVTNTVDPDQIDSKEHAILDLHCFFIESCPVAWAKSVDPDQKPYTASSDLGQHG